MYNTSDLTIEGVSTNICQNCGNPTISYVNAPSAKKVGIIYPIVGWFFSIISLLFVPILFGVVAFAMGLFTFYERNKAHGTALMVFASICLILGSLLSFVVSGTLFL